MPFPWLEFLGAADRTSVATEVVDVAQACAAVSQFDRLLETLTAWCSTAEAVAAGYTHDEDLPWIHEPNPVADPRDTRARTLFSTSSVSPPARAVVQPSGRTTTIWKV